MLIKKCIICGKNYEAFSDKQLYCSLECAKIRIPMQKLTCKHCGNIFYSQRKKLYCCKMCEQKHKVLVEKNKRKSLYEPKLRICKYCGNKFEIKYGDKRKVFCSELCAIKYKYFNERHSEKHKLRNKKIQNKRSIQIKKTAKNNFTYSDIYKRDKGICQICGLPVSKNKKINNNWFGTIDHVIPLSVNGKHTIDNCQLAHNICNAIKMQNDSCKIDWIKKAKSSERWKEIFDQYLNDMLINGEITLNNSKIYFYNKKFEDLKGEGEVKSLGSNP